MRSRCRRRSPRSTRRAKAAATAAASRRQSATYTRSAPRRSGTRLLVLGYRRRGRQRDGPFNHKTGRGFVEATRGQYYDALVVKRSRVVPFIVETFGGVTPHALAHVAYLARRARGKGARDGTKYGASRTSARGFVNHHVERVGLAAQQYDAKAIRKTVRSLKQAQVSRATAGCAAGMA